MGRLFSNYNIRYLTLVLLPLIFLILGSLYIRNSKPVANRQQQPMIAFTNDKYDASGLVDVPGTDGVLFVDNKRRGQVLWMKLDQGGRQVNAVKPIELGVNIEDLEGMAVDETYFTVSARNPSQRRLQRKALSDSNLTRVIKAYPK